MDADAAAVEPMEVVEEPAASADGLTSTVDEVIARFEARIAGGEQQ